MARLKDLEVDFVSLVDKAAARSPTNPDEPRRFLIYKHERAGIDKKEKPMASNLAEHIRTGLREHADEAHSDIRPRLSQMADLLDERRDATDSTTGESGGEEKVVKAMIAMDRLRKSEDTLPATREHADRAFRALALEHLGASNPRAAAEYEAARAA